MRKQDDYRRIIRLDRVARIVFVSFIWQILAMILISDFLKLFYRDFKE